METVDELMQRGAALYQQKKTVDARAAFASALELQPDFANARYNLAITCRDLGDDDEAADLFQSLVDEQPFAADARNNLGILSTRNELWQQAEAYFRSAIQQRYQFPLAHFNLATLLLRLGKYSVGWQEQEWRWQTPMFTPLKCPHPQWDGTPLDGTLLLHTEQGAGDTFQFARYIPMIRDRVRRLIFVRPASLDCMFTAPAWADEVRSEGDIPLDLFQAVLPLMSAPLVFDTVEETIPAAIPYLTPAERKVDLGACHVPDARLKVGFGWAGSPTHSNDAYRSTTVDLFAPLFDVPDVAFYSLQKGPQTEQLRERQPYPSVIRDLDDLQSDFADTAAIMRQLDLVITVDTSLLHLAGGLGLPVWGLLSRRSDWRWLGNDREESPWYPTLRLFRQSATNDWNELMGRVAVALKAHVDRQD